MPVAGSATGNLPGLLPAHHGPWSGLQVGSAYSVARLCNLTAESGKTLDDDLIAELLSSFPSAKPATHLVMNKRSLMQLRNSRTAYRPNGFTGTLPHGSFRRWNYRNRCHPQHGKL